jgi:hypothetical protein
MGEDQAVDGGGVRQLREKGRQRLQILKNRSPDRSEVIAVLGVSVFVCHSWSIWTFLHEFPSFLLYFRPTEISVVFAYMMAFAFLESLLVTTGLVVAGAILPSKWLRDGFAYKGFIFVVVGSIAAFMLQKNLRYEFPSTQMLTLNLVIPLTLIAVFIAASHMWGPLQKVLLDIQDRISIMLYVYGPIGLVSILVVVFRNLF